MIWARRNPESSDGGYRFSLDKQLGRHIDSKTEAEAARLRVAIDDGKFGQPERREDMTSRQLADAYMERYVNVNYGATEREYRYSLNTICRTVVPRPTGGSAPRGDWRLSDIVTDTVNRFREIRLAQSTGVVGVNRNVRRLRALFAWAVTSQYADRTPFRVNGEKASIPLSTERPRRRRLDTGEEAALLAVSDPLLRALIVAAIDSGMRQGEILSLQWSQIEGMVLQGQKVTWAAATSRFFLPAEKTKTDRDRRVPISSRLKALLEMRRFDPTGQPHSLDAYVFGNEVGDKLLGFRRAWYTAILKSHGHEPEYTKTKNLTPASRSALGAINLHFYDLRREAGSRWLEGGVSLHRVRGWLGHENVAQTSTYLAVTEASEDDAMRGYEERQAELQRIATKAGKRGRKRIRSAVTREEKLNKNAVEREPAIM